MAHIFFGKPTYLSLNIRQSIVSTLAVMLMICSTNAFSEQCELVKVGTFSQNGTTGWESIKFKDNTQYSLVEVGGIFALKAVSKASASGLVRSFRVDLDKTPYLNWRWRIEKELEGVFDETLKSGDDYSARIYVIFSDGFIAWDTKAINYVWAKHAKKESVWSNAWAGKNAVMTAIRTASDKLSQWYTEKRNVKKDIKKHFGKTIRYLNAVAVMTDTDNTKKTAVAYYGDIYFSCD